MHFLIKVSIYILIIQCCEVVCRPHYHVKNFEKRFHFEVIPLPYLPFKHVAFVLEKITPFGKFELKHNIHKRQVAQGEMLPISNEIPVTNLVIDDIPKIPGDIIVEKKEESAPEVIISSIIKPVEKGKSISFILPVESEVVITPAEKGGDVIKEIPSEVLIKPEIVPKPEEVLLPPDPIIEITPKPVVILPPPLESKPVVENVVISTPIESTVPPLIPGPIFPNPIGPIKIPSVNNIPSIPTLYTDISQIPLGGVPYPAPVPIPIPDIIIPPPPPPPPPIKEPPVVKEETPNFFVKGSRFVLYFGSMMLQMLTQLVNGRINLNQPLPTLLPGIQ